MTNEADTITAPFVGSDSDAGEITSPCRAWQRRAAVAAGEAPWADSSFVPCRHHKQTISTKKPRVIRHFMDVSAQDPQLDLELRPVHDTPFQRTCPTNLPRGNWGIMPARKPAQLSPAQGVDFRVVRNPIQLW